MADKPKTKGFENLQVYQLAEKLADEVWKIVATWQSFAKDTTGKQLVRSADSIGANIAKGTGRGSYQDNRRFVKLPEAHCMKPDIGCGAPINAICSTIR